MSSNSKTTTSQANANAKRPLRKPTFIKVEQLKPGTSGHTLLVKILSSSTVLKRGRSVSQNIRNTQITECLVGDDTGTIIFTARNDQGIQCIFGYLFRFFFDNHKMIYEFMGFENFNIVYD